MTIIIDFLREIGDLLEADQSKLEESFTLDKDVHLYMENHADDPDVQTLQSIFEKAKIEDLSMQDNVSFMLGSIHKRIGKYKRAMKDTSTN